MAKDDKDKVTRPKTREQYSNEDVRVVQKNTKSKKILISGIGPDNYNRISTCTNSKKLWDTLQTARKDTNQITQSKINMLIR